MHHLALYTFGVLKAPHYSSDPFMQEFRTAGGAVYERIGGSPGYLAHASAPREAKSPFDKDWGPWGEFAVPHWYDRGTAVETWAGAATLSLWTDLESAYEFVYTGVHRSALHQRADWFEKTGRPGLVFWWIPADVTPRWKDGASRLEYLDAHDSAAYAFSFLHPFTPEGSPAAPGHP